MPVWNTANNIKRGSSQVIKMLRGGNSPWAAYNAATGGTVTDVANYNGSGETWRVHTFTSSSTLNVTQAVGVFPFRVLVVGGGGGGGTIPNLDPRVHGYSTGPGGGGGTVVANDAMALTAQAYPVTVGAAGNGGQPGQHGGDSTFSTLTATGGGGGGRGRNGGTGWTGGGGGAGGSASGKSGGIPLASDITGASTGYAGGGAGNGHPPDGGSSGTSYRNTPGGGGNNRGVGMPGTVIVAYRIG